jgi:protoporphyrinogen oxidase
MVFPSTPTKPLRAPRIAIVGGGPSGLFTAWQIEQMATSAVTITVFEASHRVGGKLVTPAFASVGVRYEAGAAELYDYEPVGDDPLRDLIRSLGLPTVPLVGGAVYMAGQRIACLDDLEEAHGSAARDRLVAFDTWARGAMTPHEFFESGCDHAIAACPSARFHETLDTIGSPGARGYVEAMIHSDLATEPMATTANYGLQNYLMNDPAYMRLYRIAGGNEQIVTTLATRIAAAVRLDAAVHEIRSEDDGRFTVSWRSADHTYLESFDIVIVALPVAALASVTFRGDTLAAAMQRHITHHDHPAHYLRITHVLDGPAPPVPGEDDYLMVDAFGGACLYVESSRDPVGRHGVLGWLIGGEPAETMAHLTDDALVAAALDALPPPLAECRGRVLETRVHRWIGAVSAVPGGWLPLPVSTRHRPSPDHPTLFVAGDYLYDSTLNGALDSAEYVAGWVAAELTRASPSVSPETPEIPGTTA